MARMVTLTIDGLEATVPEDLTNSQKLSMVLKKPTPGTFVDALAHCRMQADS